MIDNQAKDNYGTALELTLDRLRKKTVSVPSKIESYEQFTTSVEKIRDALGAIQQGDSTRLIHSTCYLLGWIVGDGSKHRGSRRWLTMDFCLQLTRKHAENVQLGEYVAECLRRFGVPCFRGRDGEPRRKVPNGFFSWHSHYSSIVGWLFLACVGLEWEQKTTKDPVRMTWLLGAPEDFRKWFLRGLADSDGDVHFQHRWVDIATSPNTDFVKSLFESLGLHTRVRVHRGYGYVSISASDADKIQIFNPELLTYRRIMLEKLAHAKIFQGSWPDWLESKVESLIRTGLSEREISERVLDEDKVYLRMRTIKTKRGLVSRMSQR